MHVLFLSHYFPPEVNAPANRVFEHARRWVADGHRVTVVTGVPNHPRGELHPGYRNRWRQEEVVDGIRVIRTWMYVTPNEGFFRRTLNYVLFAFTALLAARRVRDVDVLVATSPQFFCGLAGAAAARWLRVPFVLELRDLWPDSIVQLGQVRHPLGVRALEALERRLYRSADGIVVVTESFRDHVVARGVSPGRVELVYAGIDVERFQPRPPDPELRSAEGLGERFVAAYVGTLGLAHGLETVLDAAERLREDPEFLFVFVGEGAERQRLEALARERALANVRFAGLRPREEIPAWIASCDALLVMLRDLAVFETVIPSKTFEYLAQERPVVVAARGEIRRLVEGSGAGLCIDPEDPDALAAALRHLRAEPGEAEARARKGRAWVVERFDRRELARRMMRFLERISRTG